MPADDSPSNPFRFVNMGSPLADSGETETNSALLANFPRFWCPNPTALEAHVIPRRSGGNFSDDDFGVNQVTTVGGSTSVTFVDNIFSTNDPVPDLLHSFNLQDGLVCVNAEQPGHRACQNYQTRYFCGRPGSPLWTQWFDTDSPASDAAGDDESRSKVDFNVLAVCGGAQPIGIAIRRGWIP